MLLVVTRGRLSAASSFCSSFSSFVDRLALRDRRDM
jgi:hypothetical protein